MTNRDKQVINEIASGKFFTREQIQVLYFANTQGPVKTQERLRKLYQAKLIKRRRMGDTGQYVYYAEGWSEKWRHWVALNQVKVELMRQTHNWQKLAFFKREYVFDSLRADALVAVDNAVTKKRTVFFVEVDNATNPFTDKYAKLAEKLELSLDPPWWYTGGFPRVLVVTTRPDRVKEVVAGSPVRYCVATLEQVKGDVWRCLSGGK